MGQGSLRLARIESEGKRAVAETVRAGNEGMNFNLERGSNGANRYQAVTAIECHFSATKGQDGPLPATRARAHQVPGASVTNPAFTSKSHFLYAVRDQSRTSRGQRPLPVPQATIPTRGQP